MAVSASEFLEWAITVGIYPPTGGGGGLTPIAANTFLANKTGSPAVPVATVFSASNLGLGTLSEQDAATVDITGGTAILTELSAPFTYFAITGDTDILPSNSLTAFEYTTGSTDLADALGLSHYADGMTFSLKNTSGSACTFTPFAGEFIDGAASLTLDNQAGYLITKDPTQWSVIASNLGDGGFLSNSLLSARLFVGNGSNIATGVALTGDASITNAGVISVLSANNILLGYATTATAAATTTLVVGSKYQQYFTGTTIQTVLLPVVSTLALGKSYYIVNNSTGVVTVQSSGSNTIKAMAPNSAMLVTVIAITGTTAASWSYEYALQSGGGLAAGSTGDVQFNASGVFAADTGNFTWSLAHHSLAIGNSSSTGTAVNSLAAGFSATVSNGVAGGFALGQSAIANADFSYAVGLSAYATHAGSMVLADGEATGNTDSAVDQFVSTFAGGYYNYVDSTLAASIDTANNVINHKGQADQSTSYQVPSTGFSITPAAGVRTLALAPSGTLATGTIVLSSLAPIDQQLFRVYTTNTITALTLSGATVNNAPTTLAAGSGFDLQYNLANTAWNPVYQASAGGGGSAAGTTGDIQFNTSGAFAADTGNFVWDSTNHSLTAGLGASTVGNAGSVAIGISALTADQGIAIGYHANIQGSNSLAIGYEATVLGPAGAAIGYRATSTNSGSFVIADGHGDGNTDALADQFVASFLQGYLLYMGTHLVASIDASKNFITNYGQADQSTSYQVPSTGFTSGRRSYVNTCTVWYSRYRYYRSFVACTERSAVIPC